MEMPKGMEGLDSLWNSDVITLRSYSLLRQPGQKIEIKPLPYPMDGLEPVISEENVNIHYDGHHQAYVDDLNDLLP